jgi:hypothetical protein
MLGLQGPLGYLVVSAGVSLVILIALIVYGNTLSLKEDDQFHINKAQEEMASDQGVLVNQMNRLKRVIIVLAVLSGALLLASAADWVWIGLKSS